MIYAIFGLALINVLLIIFIVIIIKDVNKSSKQMADIFDSKER